MKVADLVQAMEMLAPTRLAARWDNVGLLVGDPESSLDRALLAIDCTRRVLDEAVRGAFGAVIAYHPPLFDAQRRFTAGSIAFEAARAKIALYSPHTALDAVEGGTNDVLADALGMTERAPLVAIDPPEAARPGCGFGRVGAVDGLALRALVSKVKAALGADHVLMVGDAERPVFRAAVCAGSAGDFVLPAIDAGAQLLVAGELRHHDALRAMAANMAVVCLRHSVSERPVLANLERALARELPGLALARSSEDRDPFAFA